MDFLIFISSLSSGGAERVTANLACYCAEKGWSVTVVTLSSPECDFYVLPENVRRIPLNLWRDSPHPVIALVNGLRRVFALRRVLSQIKPDVTLALMDKNNVLLALSAIGIKGGVHIGSERIHPPRYPLGWVWECLRRLTYRKLDAVVVLTHESADWVCQHTSARCVEVIPNAVVYPLPFQEPRVATPTKAHAGERILLAVGRLVEQKGFDVLVSAFQRLVRQFPNWRLIILGEGPLRMALAQQIADAGLEGRVELPGRVGNVGEWYQAADLYVMSSRFEGFPNALAEAMAHGLAAVSFDCDTGPRDIIRHEVDGLLVSPGDAEALTEALTRLMADDVLRQQYAARAIEVRERFSMERVAGRWEALFEKLLKQPTSQPSWLRNGWWA